MEFEKEKACLKPLPCEAVRKQYKIRTTIARVNSAGMVTIKSNQYSVPCKYIGQDTAPFPLRGIIQKKNNI